MKTTVNPTLTVPAMKYEKITRGDYLKAWELAIRHMDMLSPRDIDVEAMVDCFCDHWEHVTTHKPFDGLTTSMVFPELETRRFGEVAYMDRWGDAIFQVMGIGNPVVTGDELLEAFNDHWRFFANHDASKLEPLDMGLER